jgi:osmotically-inducible protein OsmY
MKKLLFIAAAILSLQGCIFVVGAAAGAAAAAGVYDHRKVEKVVADEKITNKVVYIINRIPGISDNSHISVATFNQVVLLTGEVTTPQLRQAAEGAARSVDGVNQVYNQITIQGPTSSLTRASDSWITAKIKTQMLATKGLKSGTIKVITENGTVYLMGMVSHDQADGAVDISRQVSGVQKVVKIFQYSN